MQVKDGLLSAFPGISVVLNSEMPRRGCFEIREEDGETFTSLLNMKRPFPPLKGLDMDKVTSIISTGSKAQPMHLIEFGWSLKSVLGGLIEN